MSSATYPAMFSLEQQNLLSELLAKKGISRLRSRKILQREPSGPLPLSFAQQRLWFIDQLTPGSAAYNVPSALRLRGPLQIDLLQKTFQEIVRRHEVLRTRFVAEEGVPFQVIEPESTLQLSIVDLTALAPEVRERTLLQLAREEAQRPFDLAHGPLLRAGVVRMNEEEHGLLVTLHHIVSDGWSMGILTREVTELYAAFVERRPSPLKELPIQYADYAVWQRQWLQGDVLEQQLAYWKEQLAGELPVLQLPTDRPRPAVPSFRGGSESFQLSQDLSMALQTVSRQEDVTVFMLLLASFQILLSRYSGQSDILVGTPIANRTHTEIEGLIGFFVNTLVLRSNLRGDPSVRQLLQCVREAALGAYAHQDLPFERLVEEFSAERDPSRPPLVQVMFAIGSNNLPSLQLPEISVKNLAAKNYTARFDLSLFIEEGAAELSGDFNYNLDLFDGVTIERMMRHWEVLLEGMVADPEREIGELPLLRGAERQQVLEEWNATRSDYRREACLHELIEEQAAAWPDRVAVVFEDRQLTYGELNRRANQLGHELQRRGVGPEVPVGVCLERSLELMIALLAVLKAGGVYVPLDPETPLARLAYMLEDAGIAVLVTQEWVTQSLPKSRVPVITFEADGEDIAAQSTEDVIGATSLDQLAYVIYTSGSTGRPKGVMISHFGLMNYLTWCEAAYEVSAGGGAPVHSSVSVDMTVTSLWAPLLAGSRVVLVADEVPVEGLGELLAREGDFSLLKVTPSHLEVLREQLSAEQVSGRARRLVIGGEALHEDQLQWWRTHAPATRLINEYGPTETVVGCCVYESRTVEAGRVPIGRPIANTQIYVLDVSGQPVPVGVPGELYIGGAGLARGYRGRPELTAERFVPDPFGPAGGRLYRTGDLARYRADGTLEYLGRMDHQVKLRGFRIELGEIEAVLRQCPGVSDAVVMVREDQPGRQQLAGYVVGDIEDVAEVRESLKRQLPDYMVPTAWLVLKQLPLTASGKIDRRALPPPDVQPPGTEAVLPRTAVEELLAGIWQDVLGHQQVSVNDNFFALGGDSILSIQVVARARQAGLALTVRQVFQQQTIEGLARVAEVLAAAPTPLPVRGDGKVPLTPIQHWFMEQQLPDVHHYNHALLMEMNEPLLPGALERLAAQWLRDHDALRMRVRWTGEQWEQTVADDESPVPVTHLDLSAVSAVQQRAMLTAATHCQTSLDLTAGPLLRVVWFDRGIDESAQVLLIIHHWAVDGVSWRVLLESWQLGYAQLKRGAPLPVQVRNGTFQDWANHLQRYTQTAAARQELDYWVKQGQGRQSRLQLDHTAGPNTIASAQRVTVELNAEETRMLLQEVPGAYRTQIQDVLLTAVMQTLHLWTGEMSWVIDVEGHGREELDGSLDPSHTVGWFTSLYPVQLTLPDAPDTGAILKTIKEQLRSVPQHGIGYGLLRYLHEDASVREQLHQGTPPEISFNYLGQWDTVLTGTKFWRVLGQSGGATQSSRQPRSHLLAISGMVLDGRLQMYWAYSKNYHRSETIQKLANQFLSCLRSLIQHCLSPHAGGFTPSDFPLTQIDQAHLDRLVGTDRNIDTIYPLSPLQQGMLFHVLNTPNAGLYHVHFRCRLHGILHPDVFFLTWKQLLDRHGILRTSFHWENLNHPVQMVHKHVQVPFAQKDWTGLPREDQELGIDEFLRNDLEQGFDLGQAPLMRLTLIRLADEIYEFIWSYHHLLLDGWCLSLLLNEVLKGYRAALELRSPPLYLPRPFQDYIRWLQQKDMRKAKAFWQERLRDFDKPTPLGVDSHMCGTDAHKARSIRQQRGLSLELTAKIQAFARHHQLTINTIAQSAWALILSRYSGERDVLFGTVVSGRPGELAGVESMIGVFINTLSVRIKVEPTIRVLAWLAQVQDQQLEIRQYEYSPLTDVQGWSGVPRGTPLFESILVFENYPVERIADCIGTGLRIGKASLWDQDSYPLNIIVAPDKHLMVQIRSDATRFETAMVERMLSHWECAFEGLVANPRGRVDDISLLTASERRQVLEEWNATRSDYRREACLHELIEEQAAAWPDRVAVVFEDRQLTYGELNRRANQLGHELQQRGVGPEVPVGVCLERSLELMIALLAVLKAGGVYVPLDPEAPLARLAYMLEDAGIAVLVTQERVSQRLPSSWMQVITFEADGEDIAAQSTEDVIGATLLDQLAYVIYTSGSTGRPKGVMISHFGLMNYLTWCEAAYEVSAGGGAPVHSSVSVDMTVTSLWAPLLAGSRVVLVADEVPVEGLGELLAREGDFSLLKVTPSHLEVLREQLSAEQVSGRARRLVIGGEALHEDQLQWWRTHAPATRLINEYGPTETVVGCCVYESRTVEAGRVPIGRPIANTQIYVLDVSGQPVPVGVPGELYIGGAGLARGYRGRPELTAERFVPDPFGPAGGRLYRTGDLARYRADGTLEYLGRMDHQVKLRGFRIELGEIEAVLRQCPGVSDAVVMVREDQPGQQQLAGYVVGDIEDVAEVRESLKRQLPDYMVPTAWLVLKQLPLTASGKIDRRALPPPDVQPPGTEAVLPRTAVEELLAGIWQDVLGHQQVSVNDDFFALGGHSLLATQVTSRIRQTFAIELPLRDLFEAPQLWELAERIEHVRSAGTGLQSPPLVRLPRTGPLPLSFAQQRLWFIDQLTPGSAAYNVPSALRLRGPLQIDLLQKTFQEIVRRHEVLRTRFVAEEGVPFQVIEPESTLQLSIVDLTALAPEVRERTLLQLAREEAQRPFDLAHGPLLRAGVVRMNEEEHGLLVTLHHIVSDGWSVGVLTREVTELYAAFVERRPSPLKELPIQYADYAVWQRQWLQGDVLEQQLAYWKEQLAGELPRSSLKTDLDQPPQMGSRGYQQIKVVSKDLTDSLKTLCRQEEITLFMILLAPLQVWLSHEMRQQNIVVGTDVANRRRGETENLIGFFINLLALRTDLSGNPTFRELLARVREVTLGALAHQDLPFERLIEALRPNHDLWQNPLFQVLFVLQNMPREILKLPSLTLAPLPTQNRSARFDLGIFVVETNQQLTITCQYRADLFKIRAVNRMLDAYETLLSTVVSNPDVRLNSLYKILEVESMQRSIKYDEYEAASAGAFRNTKAQSIPESLVQIGYINPEKSLPAICPTLPDVDLADWAQGNLPSIESELLEHGAVLFRGFGIESAGQFEAVAKAIYPELYSEYGDLPREEVGNKIYTSTPYPANEAILFHNESSHQWQWPTKIYFFCITPPSYGGETPLVSCRKVYQEIPEEIRTRFLEKKLLYVRNYIEGLDVSWRTFFNTNERADVEEQCRHMGMTCQWQKNGALKTSRICPAIIRHPVTRELVFFNQIQLHHPACLPASVRSALESMFGEIDLPRNVYYGDGTPIESEVMHIISRIYQDNTISFSWQKGDVLLVDNILTAHGRNPFEGSRKILVAMADMTSESGSLQI